MTPFSGLLRANRGILSVPGSPLARAAGTFGALPFASMIPRAGRRTEEAFAGGVLATCYKRRLDCSGSLVNPACVPLKLRPKGGVVKGVAFSRCDLLFEIGQFLTTM